MLPAGARFGPYEIVSPLGAGGMGEVYRGHDTTLHRSVAIKVLPDSVARDPERILRLQREARTLASLNDPNIGGIYGFVDTDGRHALVLELVEGPTLADRIAQGALPFAESVAIASQIAKALDTAHALGVIHRDLKPANIKVRDDGAVKVLDFGLAKALDPVSGDPTSSPTITSPAMLTATGVIIGTAAYMSPEQARGLAADKRSDIWAFGCVLYEMLAGRRAFEGPGVTETLAAVLRGEPDWTALQSDVPGAVRTLLVRCLEKDRSARVQDISIARFVLAEYTKLGAASTASATVGARGSVRAWWVAAAALAGAAIGAAAVALVGHSPAGTPPQTARFEVTPAGVDRVGANTTGEMVALSPDGSSIVYVGVRDGISRLVVRRLDSLESTALAGTEGGLDPFFSPDGQQIGFFTPGELKRIPIDGGRSTTIFRGDPTFEGASWGADGTIVFGQDESLWQINVSGGSPTKIAQPDPAHDEVGYDRPFLLPGGRAVLYTVVIRGGRHRIALRRLTGETKVLIEDGYAPRYVPPGYLVFAQRNRLLAVAFNPAAERVSGSPVEMEQGLFTNPGDSVSNAAVSGDGTAVFLSGSNSGAVGRPIWADRRGTRLSRIVDDPLEFPRNPRVSPDGKRLALAVGPGGQADIWTYRVIGQAQPIKLTFRDHNNFPIWSPDGKQIVFLHLIGAKAQASSIASDGSATQPQPLTSDESIGVPMDWSPRESALLLYAKTTLWLLRPPGKTVTQWIPAPFTMFGARFSPDGRWVAYVSTQSGAADVYLRPFPGPGAPVRVSSAGGHEPVWSHDGHEIFFTNGSKMMVARISTFDPSPVVETPQQLFDGGFATDNADLVIRFYDVAPDGRLLLIEPAQTKAPTIVVAQHWSEQLKRRLHQSIN